MGGGASASGCTDTTAPNRGKACVLELDRLDLETVLVLATTGARQPLDLDRRPVPIRAPARPRRAGDDAREPRPVPRQAGSFDGAIRVPRRGGAALGLSQAARP